MAWKDLSREERIELWVRAEQVTLALLESLGDLIATKDRENVRRFVDASEFRLAFEQLVLCILEDDKSLTVEQYAEFESLYQFFGGPADEVDDAVMAKLKGQASR